MSSVPAVLRETSGDIHTNQDVGILIVFIRFDMTVRVRSVCQITKKRSEAPC